MTWGAAVLDSWAGNSVACVEPKEELSPEEVAFSGFLSGMTNSEIWSEAARLLSSLTGTPFSLELRASARVRRMPLLLFVSPVFAELALSDLLDVVLPGKTNNEMNSRV